MQSVTGRQAAGKHTVREFLGRWLVIRNHRLIGQPHDTEETARRIAAELDGAIPPDEHPGWARWAEDVARGE